MLSLFDRKRTISLETGCHPDFGWEGPIALRPALSNSLPFHVVVLRIEILAQKNINEKRF
jgi:hypothetical protein